MVFGLVIIVGYKVKNYPFKNGSVTDKQKNGHEQVQVSISELYMENCMTCHGNVGQGQSGFLSLQNTKLDVSGIKELISTGKSDMPAFPHIKEPQLSQLAKMVKQFSD